MGRTLRNSESLRILTPPVKIGTLLFNNKSLMSSKFPALPTSMEKTHVARLQLDLVRDGRDPNLCKKKTLSMVKTFPFFHPNLPPENERMSLKRGPFQKETSSSKV